MDAITICRTREQEAGAPIVIAGLHHEYRLAREAAWPATIHSRMILADHKRLENVFAASLESSVFHHILIPTDLSGRTTRAVDMARDLGQPAGARITLFHVIETVSGADYDEFGSFYRELEGRASGHLAALAARFEGSGLEVARIVVCGKPAGEIVRFAVDEQVELIVLASHRIDLSRPGHGWGTLSYKIGVLAPCHVLLVK